MEVADPQDVKYQCPCGWIGGYAQVNGHRLGSRDPLCKSAAPKVLIDRTRTVFAQAEDSETEEPDTRESSTGISGLEEEAPEEGVPTAAQGRPPELKVAGPSTAKGPVGVPSAGVSIDPSTVRVTVSLPIGLLMWYDWAKAECGYRDSFVSFLVETYLNYWTEKWECENCGAIQSGYTMAVVPR